MFVNKYYYYKLLFNFKFFQDSTVLYNQYFGLSLFGSFFDKYVLDFNYLLIDFFVFNKIFLYTILNDKKFILLFSRESMLYSISLYHFNVNFLNIGLIDFMIKNNHLLFKSFKGFYTNYLKLLILKNLRKKVNLLLLYSKLIKHSNLFYLGQFGFNDLRIKNFLNFKFILNINDYIVSTNTFFPDFFITFIENKMSSYFYEWCSLDILNSCFCNLSINNFLLKKVNYPVVVGDYTADKIFFLVSFLIQNFSIGLLDCFFNYIFKIECYSSVYSFENSVDNLNFFLNIKFYDLTVKKKILLQFLFLKKKMKFNFNARFCIFIYLYILYIFNNLNFNVDFEKNI